MKISAMLSAAAFSAASLLAASPMLFADQVKADHPVQVQLTSKVDSKSASVGAPIAAKLLEKANMGGTAVPAGSKLTGKVTAVSKGSITLAFDTLEVKGRDPKAVHAEVVSVAPKPNLSDAGPSGSALPTPGRISDTAGTTGSSLNMQASDLLADLPVGSTIKGVTMVPSTDGSTVTLTSSKDLKLDSGTRMEVGLWTGSK